jgi:hypothetical protein
MLPRTRPEPALHPSLQARQQAPVEGEDERPERVAVQQGQQQRGAEKEPAASDHRNSAGSLRPP